MSSDEAEMLTLSSSLEPLNPCQDEGVRITSNGMESSHSLLTHFQSYLSLGNFVDMSLECGKGGDIIKCHRLVLAASSTLFKKLLLLIEDDDDSPTIIIPDLNINELALIVQAIYFNDDHQEEPPPEAIIQEWLNYLGIVLNKSEGNSRSSSSSSTLVQNEHQSKFKIMKSCSMKTFDCIFCAKTFKTESYLNAHMQVHNPEKIFSCKICDKKFQSLSSLSQHRQIHKSLKNDAIYKCEKCDKTFVTKRCLIQHARKHDSRESFQKTCEICNKVLAGRYELRCHLRIHTGERPFKCHLCQATFRNRSTKNNHVKTHLGDKKAICHICNHSFVQNGDLKKHLRSHTGERPYSCNICQRAFARMDYLHKHFKTHKIKSTTSNNVSEPMTNSSSNSTTMKYPQVSVLSNFRHSSNGQEVDTLLDASDILEIDPANLVNETDNHGF